MPLSFTRLRCVLDSGHKAMTFAHLPAAPRALRKSEPGHARPCGRTKQRLAARPRQGLFDKDQEYNT
ncbi:hypothetical protein GT354_51370 [Streptomyces sp. SID3343]|nr:hypothetical protein [Streptomyces sp. SID3343]